LSYSYPLWLVAYLRKDYDDVTLEKILKVSDNEDKMTAIRVNTLKANNEYVEKELQNSGFDFRKVTSVENGYLVKKAVQKTALHRKGEIVIQDISSQMVAEVMKPQHDLSILDLCAAPGGKTAHIAALMNNYGTIYACDIYKEKLKLMEKQLDRLGVTNVKIQLIDARDVKDHAKENSFDQILADLPCSGLGVLEHKADIKYNISIGEIEKIIKLQEEILENSYKLLKRSGVLTYSTCTINKDENEVQIAKFLSKHEDFEKIFEKTILPFEGDGDGFYICQLRRI
jgi:16S rRNA (cytosine967-C5)-methyltransferase